MLYKEIVRGNVIRKHIVRKYLDTVVIKWSEEMGDFREDYDVPCKIKFNDEEFDAIFVQGHDGSGSCGTEEQFLLNASALLDGYWPENLIKQGMKGGNTMSIYRLVGNERESRLIEEIGANTENISWLHGKEKLNRRIRVGKLINELSMLIGKRRKELVCMPNEAVMGILLWICNQYIDDTRNCTNKLVTDERDQVELVKDWAKLYISVFIIRKQKTKAIEDADVEKHLTESKDHSRKFKVVVSRDGNGSNADHYKLHGPLLPQDADDDCSIKKHFDGWEEFLTDEDGKRADQNLRDVTVREVRLGKIVAKIEPVQEVVYKVVKK